MATHSNEAVALVNNIFMNISQHTECSAEFGERLKQEIAQTDSLITDLEAELDRRRRDIELLQVPPQVSFPTPEPLKLAIDSLVRLARPLSEDLGNLEVSYFFEQVFDDFMLCQAFNIRMAADFEDAELGFPPAFRYGLANPYERAQFLRVLCSLSVFKPVKHAARPERAFPDVPPPRCLLRMLLNKCDRIKDVAALHNNAVAFIGEQYETLQQIDLHDTNDILEAQLALLTALANGETCFSQVPVPRPFKFAGEFWRAALYLDGKSPNFPMAAQAFQCMAALGGECLRYRHLYFFCIFETEFNDIEFDYQPVNLPALADRDTLQEALNVVQTQIPELAQYFSEVEKKISAVCRLADALCPDAQVLGELVQFACELLANKFLALFVSPECVSNLQYFKALFLQLISNLRDAKIDRKRIIYENRLFGFPKFAPNDAICHQKTFLDEFAASLERPDTENYFIEQMKLKLRCEAIESAETVNLEDDISYELGEFTPNGSYEEFGLVPLQYDFAAYIINYILALPRDDMSEGRRRAVDALRQRKALSARVALVLQGAKTDFEQRMRKMIAEIDEFQERAASTQKAEKVQKDVSEASIREKYRAIPPEIANTIRDAIAEVETFLAKNSADTLIKAAKSSRIDEFIGPNCVFRRMIPDLPVALLEIADYNACDGDRVTFDQKYLTQYFEQLKDFKFDAKPFYAVLTQKQFMTLRRPWPALARDVEQLRAKCAASAIREQERYVRFEHCDFDAISRALSKKLFRKQVSLEEAALQLRPLTSQSYPILYEFQEALEHIAGHVRNQASTNIVLDPLPMCTALRSALSRLFVLASEEFSPALPPGIANQETTVWHIGRIVGLYFDQIGQRMMRSAETLVSACHDALGLFYIESGAFVRLSVPSLSVPQSIYSDTKLLKRYNQYISAHLFETVPLQRKSEAQLAEELKELGLTPLGLPLGFCPSGVSQRFFHAHLAAPYAPECSAQVPLVDLLQRAAQAAVYVITHLNELCDTLAPIQPLLQIVTAHFQTLQATIVQTVQKLERAALEALVAGVRVIWSEVGPKAYDFAAQKRVSASIDCIPDCSQSAPLLADSTPAHAALVLQLFDKVDSINNIQNAAFFAAFLKDFIDSLTAHAARCAPAKLEDALLLKTEVTAYERRARAGVEKCDFLCAAEAPEITTEAYAQLARFQTIKEALSGAGNDDQRCELREIWRQVRGLDPFE